MPRRRSRSRRKNSPENESGMCSNIVNVDMILEDNIGLVEHCSSQESVEYAEMEITRLSHIGESQEQIIDIEGSREPESQNNMHKLSDLLSLDSEIENSASNDKESCLLRNEWGGNDLNQNKFLTEKLLHMKMTCPVEIRSEETDDAVHSSCIQEEWEVVRSKRLRRLQRSKERGDQEMNDNSLNDLKELDIIIDYEGRNQHYTMDINNQELLISPETASECKVQDTMPNDFSSNNDLSITNDEEISGNESDTRLSVHEIKQRFLCHVEKSNENLKSKNTTSVQMESEDITPEEVLYPEKERWPTSGVSVPCTTELYISSVGGKESSSASFIGVAESNSGILVDEKYVKFMPKSLHSGLAKDIKHSQNVTEDTNTEYSSFDTNKVSVKQLKERLISSCSDLSDKAAEAGQCDEERDLVKKDSNDIIVDKRSKGYEKEDFNVSVKEILETYRCQASKAYHNLQSSYNEEDLPSAVSIKELLSSFNRMAQPSVNPVSTVRRSKVKHVSDDIAQMQAFSMKCKSCGQQVFFMERIMAENAMWHKKCFRCKQCHKQLSVENYKSKDGELYCRSHYMNILKPKPTDETVSANSVIEEIKIPPLNLKPLFEKPQNISQNSPPFSPPPFERSSKFLKRLAKFEGAYRGNFENDEDDKESSPDEMERSSPEKKSKTDDIESYLQEEIKKKSKGIEDASDGVCPPSNGQPEFNGSVALPPLAEVNVDADGKELSSALPLQDSSSKTFINSKFVETRADSLQVSHSQNLWGRHVTIRTDRTDVCPLSKLSVQDTKERITSSCSDVDNKRTLENKTDDTQAIEKHSDACIEKTFWKERN